MAGLWQDFATFCAHVDRGRASGGIVNFCDTLRTSGSEDDVVFSHIGLVARAVYYWNMSSISAEIPTEIFCSPNNQTCEYSS